MKNSKYTFMEFFAGGGMVRAGLGDSWRCVLANDIDPQKCAAYRTNFGGDELIEGDIADLQLHNLPTYRTDLMWGSFPCQDLSLAGARRGIKGQRSGAFFDFWRLIEELNAVGRAPRIIALENVTGLLTSNGGQDFSTIARLMGQQGYRVTAFILDAAQFTPQSRPRLFIVGFSGDVEPSTTGTRRPPDHMPASLVATYELLPVEVQRNWVWLREYPTIRRNTRLSDIIDSDAQNWRNSEFTNTLIEKMSAPQLARLNGIITNKARRIGAGFRRTRMENGVSVQRFEVRFDGLAGCLRTPTGGSSRQEIVAVENGIVRTRLLSPREAARLMGLPESYILPDSANAALKLCGDGVCVPVVQWLGERIFEPSLRASRTHQAA